MKRTILLFASFSAAVLACNLGQDLGGGGGVDGGSTSSSSSSSSSSGGDGGGSSSGNVDSGASSSGNVDSGASSSGNLDSGKTGDASALPACPSVPGYEAAPYMKFTVTAGKFAGTMDTTVTPPDPNKYVLAGHYTSTQPSQSDYAGHFLVNAQLPSHIENGHFVGPEWSMALLTAETTPLLTEGSSYPIQMRFVGIGSDTSFPLDAPMTAPSTLQQDQMYRYPGGGSGSCTLVVDKFIAGSVSQRGCLNARFSCTGLTGKGSGATFDVVDGKFSYASGS